MFVNPFDIDTHRNTVRKSSRKTVICILILKRQIYILLFVKADICQENAFMRKHGSLAAIALIVLMILSCTNTSPGVPRGDATVMLKSPSYPVASIDGAKRSAAYPDVATYAVSLGAIENRDGRWVISSDQSGRRNESFPGSASEFVIKSVELGTYAVIIDAFGSDGRTKLFNGTGEDYLTVQENGSNSVAVSLASIETGRYTGSASMTFSWKDIKENDEVRSIMDNGGFVFILYYYDSASAEWVEAGRSAATGKNASTYQFEVSRLPVSTGLKLKYALTASNGTILNPSLLTATTQIFPDLVSIISSPDGTDQYSLKAEDIKSMDNVYDVSYASGPEEGTSVTVSWKNPMEDDEILFDYVTVKYSSPIASEKTVKVDVNDSETSSFTISDMKMGDEYTVSFQAHHKSGFSSSWYEYPEKIMAKIILDAPLSVSAKRDGNAFTLSWSKVSGADSYAVYRSENGREFKLLKNVGDTTAYSDSALYSYKVYAYKVMGMRGEVEGELSSQTPQMAISENVVTIPKPDISAGFDITPSDPDKLVLFPDSTDLCVSISAISEAQEYSWIINDTLVKAASADEGGTFIVIEDSPLLTEGINKLSLTVLTESGETASAPLDFMVIKTPSTGVEISPVNTRVSTALESGAKRTVQLSAATLPSSSTVKDVIYQSSNPEIATIDETTGLMTLTGGTGTVTITVSPKYHTGVSETIDFDVYKTGFTDAESLVNTVNNLLSSPIAAANKEFGGDWWGTNSWYEGYQYDKMSGIVVHSSDGTYAGSAQQTNGYIEFPSEYTFTCSVGEASIKGKLSLQAKGNNDGWAGYLGTDPLEIVGKGEGDDTLTVSLPDNQGLAYIKYNNVNVMKRGGSYTVTFEKDNGYEGNLKAGVGYTVSDTDQITAIL